MGSQLHRVVCPMQHEYYTDLHECRDTVRKAELSGEEEEEEVIDPCLRLLTTAACLAVTALVVYV